MPMTRITLMTRFFIDNFLFAKIRFFSVIRVPFNRYRSCFYELRKWLYLWEMQGKWATA